MFFTLTTVPKTGRSKEKNSVYFNKNIIFTNYSSNLNNKTQVKKKNKDKRNVYFNTSETHTYIPRKKNTLPSGDKVLVKILTFATMRIEISIYNNYHDSSGLRRSVSENIANMSYKDGFEAILFELAIDDDIF